MKKVLIIGATGSLAQYVIEALKALGNVELTLFSRSVNSLPKSLADGCEVIQGNASSYADVNAAVKGQDIVYINLAGDLETMARNIVKAMHQNNVKRVIAISSIGIYKTPLQSILKPYRAIADVIEASGLKYTIIRPDWFTGGNEIDYHITHKPEPEVGGALSRKSIAAFVASIISDPETYVNDNVGISRL